MTTSVLKCLYRWVPELATKFNDVKVKFQAKMSWVNWGYPGRWMSNLTLTSLLHLEIRKRSFAPVGQHKILSNAWVLQDKVLINDGLCLFLLFWSNANMKIPKITLWPWNNAGESPTKKQEPKHRSWHSHSTWLSALMERSGSIGSLQACLLIRQCECNCRGLQELWVAGAQTWEWELGWWLALRALCFEQKLFWLEITRN